MRSERWLPRGFLILLLAVLAVAAWQWRHGAPLSANLMELVPGESPDALELSAEQRMQEPLNRERFQAATRYRVNDRITFLEDIIWADGTPYKNR